MYWKRVAAAFLVAVMVVCGLSVKRVDALPVSVSARAAVVMCADSGEILYSKNPDEKLAIASITKIMTAVIALEQPQDKKVKFDLSMAAEGTSLYLKEGETLTLSELTKGMMLVSGNDAANAVAVGIAGSKEKFAELMNQKAQQIGMKNSHFVTPSGLDNEQHYSTAYDMAMLCRYAMNNPKFRKIVSQKSDVISYVVPQGKTQYCRNHNKLLSICEGCIGIKTGYTSKAGRTLTSCAERNGIRIIVVTLNDRDDWNDHQKLYDDAFDRVEQKTLITQHTRFDLPIVGSQHNERQSITLKPEKDCVITVRKDNEDKITKKLFLPHFLYAPVAKGRAVGEINFYRNGQLIGHTRLLTAENAD